MTWSRSAGDSLDLAAFRDLVCEEAARLAAAGDTDPLDVRKAKALGVIAARQAQPDLLTPTTDGDEQPAELAAAPARRPRTTFYLHLSLADLLALSQVDPAGAPALGSLERLGPATIVKIRDWVAHPQVTIRPVLDLARTDAVDDHDPPAWMREQVILRDRHCAFPGCARDGRTSTTSTPTSPRPGRPARPDPGQTRPEKLAPLCRRHHRCKTSGRWRYRRHPDGTYLWQAPRGRAFAVTPNGTLPLTTN